MSLKVLELDLEYFVTCTNFLFMNNLDPSMFYIGLHFFGTFSFVLITVLSVKGEVRERAKDK